jgi:hypothetical protein
VLSVRNIFVLLFLSSPAFPQNVGDIVFDARTDDPKFQLCDPNHVFQGFQLKTKMDETSIMVANELRARFKSRDSWKNENGIMRVRFLVNCSGIADRFRVLGLDFDLKEKQFNDELSAHVISISKGIPWPARRARDQTVDYYHYFSIHIVNGELTDIVQ